MPSSDVKHDGYGCPIALCGLAADITETICAGQDLASQHLVGIVDCGPALVVLLCGEFDVRWRTELEQAMDTVLHHHGTGPVYSMHDTCASATPAACRSSPAPRPN